jgi:hypothetical protein
VDWVYLFVSLEGLPLGLEEVMTVGFEVVIAGAVAEAFALAVEGVAVLPL